MTQLMMKRIRNAQETALRAQNPKFREYWNGVAEELMLQLKILVN